MSTVQQSILNKNRKDKFLLVLNLPDVLKQINKISSGDRDTSYLNQDSLQYSVYGSIVPNITVPEVALPFAGQVAHYTSYNRPAYTPVSVSFTVDNGYNNWWVLWKWLDLINNSYAGYYNADGIQDPNGKQSNSYQTNITVYGLDEYNNKKIQLTYSNAFITGLGELTYNYRDSEQIESSFTFSFGQLKAELL
jgi:hypothetical protein